MKPDLFVLEFAYTEYSVTNLARVRAFYFEPTVSPVCRLALISDPDGNSICIHKRNSA